MHQGGDEEPSKPQKEEERAAKREKMRKKKAERVAAEQAKEQEERRRQAELELLLMDEHALHDQAVLGEPLQLLDVFFKNGFKVDVCEIDRHVILISDLLYAGAKADKAAEAKARQLSRKERIKLKKAQKRMERATGSDDEDLGTAGQKLKVPFRSSTLVDLPQISGWQRRAQGLKRHSYLD